MLITPFDTPQLTSEEGMSGPSPCWYDVHVALVWAIWPWHSRQRNEPLSVAMQQMVAIARALDLKAKLLILDEPTASLDEKEVADLFAVMRRLKGEGLGFIFVTHFLDQVYAVTDRITVLRNGALVGEYLTAELPRLKLVSRMIGREVHDNAPRSADLKAVADDAECVVETKGIARRGAINP